MLPKVFARQRVLILIILYSFVMPLGSTAVSGYGHILVYGRELHRLELWPDIVVKSAENT